MMIDWEEDKSWKRVFEPKDNNSSGNVDGEEKEQKTIFGGKCLINLSSL